jgi:hypothetical protein
MSKLRVERKGSQFGLKSGHFRRRRQFHRSSYFRYNYLSFQEAECSMMYINNREKEETVNTISLISPRGRFLITDIETRPTTAVTCCTGVIHNLELAPDQLGSIVHGTAMQQLERRLIHDDLGLAR